MRKSTTDVILESLKQKAIVFTPVFPPRHEETPVCFFGGQPQLPTHIEWPAIGDDRDQSRRSLSFLAQIDCAALPRLDDCPDFPDTGTLFFFVDFMDELCFDHQDFRDWVIYHPEPVTSRPATRNPADLQYCQGDPSFFYEWLDHIDRSDRDYPRNFPRWAVEPHEIQGFRAIEYDEFDHETYTQLADKADAALQAELFRVQGRTVTRTCDYYLFPFDIEDRTILWRPHPRFPHVWIQVEMVAGYFCARIRDKPGYDDERDEAESWVARSRAAGLFTAMTPDERDEFWNWIEKLDKAGSSSAKGPYDDKRSAYTLNICISRAYQKGIDQALAESAASAGMIDRKMMADVRWRHSLIIQSIRNIDTVQHAMIGASINIQGAPERFKDTHILLMQFDSDYGRDLMWGDGGVLQYWITSEDLKSRRFNKVVVTMEGH